jgi:hypothetical protein
MTWFLVGIVRYQTEDKPKLPDLTLVTKLSIESGKFAEDCNYTGEQSMCAEHGLRKSA